MNFFFTFQISHRDNIYLISCSTGMLTARQIIKHGQISEEDLTKLFEQHPSGDQIHQYNRAALSDYLVSFRVEEPRMGAEILIREARFLADVRAGKSDVEIEMALQDKDSVLVTPPELAAFLFTKQNYRTAYDAKYIQHVMAKREAAANPSGSAAPSPTTDAPAAVGAPDAPAA